MLVTQLDELIEGETFEKKVQIVRASTIPASKLRKMYFDDFLEDYDDFESAEAIGKIVNKRQDADSYFERALERTATPDEYMELGSYITSNAGNRVIAEKFFRKSIAMDETKERYIVAASGMIGDVKTEFLDGALSYCESFDEAIETMDAVTLLGFDDISNTLIGMLDSFPEEENYIRAVEYLQGKYTRTAGNQFVVDLENAGHTVPEPVKEMLLEQSAERLDAYRQLEEFAKQHAETAEGLETSPDYSEMLNDSGELTRSSGIREYVTEINNPLRKKRGELSNLESRIILPNEDDPCFSKDNLKGLIKNINENPLNEIESIYKIDSVDKYKDLENIKKPQLVPI